MWNGRQLWAVSCGVIVELKQGYGEQLHVLGYA
jgi:hypothetical protein